MHFKHSLKILRDCLAILVVSPEDWLEFSAGQNTRANLNRFKKKSFFISLLKQILGYIKLIFTNLVLFRKPCDNKEVLFFAVSPNQFNVLHPVAALMPKASYSFVTSNFIGSNNFIYQDKMLSVEVTIRDLMLIFALNVLRVKNLWNIFSKNRELLAFRGKSILSAHFWLIYHYVLLKEIKPSLVVVANDHNAETRSLIEVCKLLNVKTAYIQHAEVSERFHSLDFDLAFLYGQHSYEVYQKCDTRRYEKSKPPKRRFYSLIGSVREKPQKEAVLNDFSKQKIRIGLLLKGTDTAEQAGKNIKHLQKFGEVIVRPHPNMKYLEIYKEIQLIVSNRVQFSDPFQTNAAEFLSGVDVIVSGNSTMLLEAAMANILPICVDSMCGGVLDYYGFVENNVAISIKDVLSISMYDIVKCRTYLCNVEAIKYFNHSFGTSHYGNEAELVREGLTGFLNGELDLFNVFQGIENG